MNCLFSGVIENWEDWGRVYQDIGAWRPLAEHILARENLPFAKMERLTPGTNAVFRVGGYVVKIFAPKESGFDSTEDMRTETFAMQRLGGLGLSVPRCVARGAVEDKYSFAYMVMEYVNGRAFTDLAKTLCHDERIAFGQKLRRITDKMNTPCEAFNGIDVINDRGRYRRWDKYSAAFRRERLEYIKKRNYGPGVFVHGDLCGDNILVDEKGEIHIIDFADAVTAPAVYEHAHVASELFRFDRAFLTGYFGEYEAGWLTELCFDGLLIHDFGGDIVEQQIAKPKEIISLDSMRERLRYRISSEKNAIKT